MKTISEYEGEEIDVQSLDRPEIQEVDPEETAQEPA